MTTPSTEVATLKSEASTLFAGLSAALAAEFAALRTRDVAALERSVVDKTALISALEAVAGKICRLDRQVLTSEFGDLRTLVGTCLEANRVNGGTIELNRNLSERLLDTLRGGTRGAPVYDASGRLRRRPGAREVGYA